MNIVARFNAGKRLNLIQRGSYQRRVHLSGLRHNKKFVWHSSPYKNIVGCSPGKYFKDFMNKKMEEDKLRGKKRLFQKENDTPRKKFKHEPKNIDYGPNVEEPEDEEMLSKEIDEVLKRLQVFLLKNIF